jgi:hypothetical protein
MKQGRETLQMCVLFCLTENAAGYKSISIFALKIVGEIVLEQHITLAIKPVSHFQHPDFEFLF